MLICRYRQFNHVSQFYCWTKKWYEIFSEINFGFLTPLAGVLVLRTCDILDYTIYFSSWRPSLNSSVWIGRLVLTWFVRDSTLSVCFQITFGIHNMAEQKNSCASCNQTMPFLGALKKFIWFPKKFLFKKYIIILFSNQLLGSSAFGVQCLLWIYQLHKLC